MDTELCSMLSTNPEQLPASCYLAQPLAPWGVWKSWSTQPVCIISTQEIPRHSSDRGQGDTQLKSDAWKWYHGDVTMATRNALVRKSHSLVSAWMQSAAVHRSVQQWGLTLVLCLSRTHICTHLPQKGCHNCSRGAVLLSISLWPSPASKCGARFSH